MTDRKFLERLRGDEFVDEIRITTVPRFKTSYLSGDEWRTSVRVQVFRKGRLVGEGSWGRLQWALERILPWMNDKLLCPIDDPRMTDELCMQPGCAEPFTVEYRKKKSGCGSCGGSREADTSFPLYRRFCDRHAVRGDSNLDDMDDIYERTDGGTPAREQVVNDADKSPSAFGGVIDLPAATE